MRYASTFDTSGAPVVAELQGDSLVPLAGLDELGPLTTAEVLAAIRAEGITPVSPTPIRVRRRSIFRACRSSRCNAWPG